jgi:hypothetical protein
MSFYTPACTIHSCRQLSASQYILSTGYYLDYTIYGNEGYISTSVGGPQVDYYQPAIQPGNYHKVVIF